LVDLMGGEMWVESEEGEGSTFHVGLSVKAAEAPKREDAPSTTPQLAGKRLLVVDDNATNLEIVARHARSWGMDAVAIASPSEALVRIADGERFDVAILDLVMPEMDGLALAREIRRHRDEHELPLVLLTSLGRLPQAQTSGDFAVQLGKPVKASQLYNGLVKALAEHILQPEADGPEPGAGKPTASSLRILLAEDNAVNQKVALRLLTQLGYRADVAANGAEALETLERQRGLDGEGFLAEVIDTFLDAAPALVAALRATHDAGDAEELRRTAHILKSNGQVFGARGFSALCRELEERARDGELEGTATLIDRIEVEYGGLEEALAALRPAFTP